MFRWRLPHHGFLGISLCLALVTPAAADSLGVTRLGWLTGTWAGQSGRLTMEETWSSPEGGGMVGMHRDLRGGRMVSYEFFRIVPDSSGRTAYITSPNGAPPTTFFAIELTDTRVVFENKAHDFPQRILYWRSHKDSLHARIEGDLDGKPHAMDWVWARRP